MHCDHCRKPVLDGAPIWRISRGYGGPPGTAVQSWCENCWTGSHYDLRNSLPPDAKDWTEDRRQRLLAAYAKLRHYQWRERPCKNCGRQVFFHGSRRIPYHAVCGDACRYAINLAQARERCARRRGTLICQTCGEQFTPQRTDARFCSSPCRQRAYRQRQQAEAA